MKTFIPSKKQINKLHMQLNFKQLVDIIFIDEYDNANCWLVSCKSSDGKEMNCIIIFPVNKEIYVDFSLLTEEKFGLGSHTLRIYDSVKWYEKLYEKIKFWKK